MPGLLPIDLRPNLLQGAGARFPMLMQQGLAQQANSLLDASSLQVRARTPFPQMEHFNRADGPFARAPNPTAPAPDNMDKANNNNNNNAPTTSDGGGQQEGDQDYRFPPPEKQSTGLLRTPPPEMRTEPTPVRTPLLERPPRGGVHMEGPGRREPAPGPFRAETRWGAPRGDLDERDMRGMPAGPPKSFQEDRGNPNFQNRFEMRGGGAMGGVGPGWNRGGGGGGGGGEGAGSGFELGAHRSVLAAATDYFTPLLGGQFAESVSRRVEMKEWSSEAGPERETVESVVQFMYTGEIRVSTSNVHEVLELADR